MRTPLTPFSCCNGTVHGVRWGKGPRLLAFHGFLDNSFSFKLLAEHLPGYEIWAIDLPGHGQSADLPKTEGSFIPGWLIPLGRVLDDLDWSSYTIVGHSLGAILSQLLAAVDSRISHLISLDGLGPLASTTAENLDRFQRLYDSRQRSFIRRQYTTYDDLIRSRYRGVFPLSEQAARAMMGNAVNFNGSTWSHRYDRQLRNESIWRLDESEIQAWLSRVSAPVDLALFGSQHWPGYREVFEQRLSALQNVRVKYIDGSHHLHMEDPALVAQWITTVLNAKNALSDIH
jgi:pimeloyl-ACP methyl ester carboxylesterase